VADISSTLKLSIKKIVDEWYNRRNPSKKKLEQIIKKIDDILKRVNNQVIKEILEYVKGLLKSYSDKLLYVEE
jgi:hypothetical protein